MSPLDDEGDDEDDDQCFCRTKMADSSSPAAGLVLNAREEDSERNWWIKVRGARQDGFRKCNLKKNK